MSTSSSHRSRPRSKSQPSLDRSLRSSFSSLSGLPTEEGIGLGISLSALPQTAELKRRPKHSRGRGSALSASTEQSRRDALDRDPEKDNPPAAQPAGLPQVDSMAHLLQLSPSASQASDMLRESALRPARRSALERQPTLLAQDPRPGELDALLGKGVAGKLRRRSQTLPSLPRPPALTANDSRALQPSNDQPAPSSQTQGAKPKGVALEQAKPLPLVSLDLRLETDTVVEGGSLRGLLEIRVRAPGVKVQGGKLRVVGFEELSSSSTAGGGGGGGGSQREVFYQHACGMGEAAARFEGVFVHPTEGSAGSERVGEDEEG